MPHPATDAAALFAVVRPLVPVAPLGGRVMLAAVAALAAAVLAHVAGATAVALASGIGGVTLALLGGAALLAARIGGHRRHAIASRLIRALADDPDPVLVTAPDGTPLARNAAAGPASLAAALHDWCAAPHDQALALLAEVGDSGSLTRVYHRHDAALRVTAWSADPAAGTILWRFSVLSPRIGPGADFALPVVSRLGGRWQPNTAARALFPGIDGALPMLDDSVAGTADPAAPRDLRLRLDSGAALVAHLRDGDGRVDAVLLPDHPSMRDIDAPVVGSRDFEDIPVALVRLEPGGRIVGSNRYARALLALGDDDERHFWELVEGLGRPVADWLADARAGRALGRPEVLRATLRATETYVQIILRRASPAAADGDLIAVISDATELKSLEARFVQSQKMQAIGQLAGGIAHDFNNLLTAISGHCDLLLLNRDRFDPDYNDLLQIHQNANRAAALVRQLLAFSRKQTLKTEILHLESLLEDLTHLLTRLVGERITVSLTHDPDIGAIRADRRQLEQVVLNLVVNARDAMPMGGTIRIETAACRLDSEFEHGRARVPAGDYALIRVIDNGIGIPPDIIDKIFEPFFTTKKLGEGTGLGLSTAYGIVKQMGGYIFVDSVEGSGSVFTLYFATQPDETRADGSSGSGSPSPPRPEASAAALTDANKAERPAAPASAAPPLAVTVPTRCDGTILLVEDEAPVRAFAARALRLQGYQVFEAQDGEQALDFLADPGLRIDLFVTDVIMPGIDGPSWVMRALETRPGTPVVFVSGYTEDTLSAALGRIPRAVFLGKPFSLHDLSETIARQLGG